jgi:hypothetical protein
MEREASSNSGTVCTSIVIILQTMVLPFSREYFVIKVEQGNVRA